MRTYIWILGLLLVFPSFGWAEQIMLRSGRLVEGVVELQTPEVIVVRTSDGQKFQFPTAEVVRISDDPAEAEAQKKEEVQVEQGPKYVDLQWDLAPAGSFLPGNIWGEAMHVNLSVGTHQIRDRRMMLGGGVGYHAYWVARNKFGFIPLQFVASIPFTDDHKDSPSFGMRLGYGFSTRKGIGGGPTAGVDIDWWHAISDRLAFQLGIAFGWQQARWSMSEVVDGEIYTSNAGRNIMCIGLKFSLQF